jgi:hypothetical protein
VKIIFDDFARYCFTLKKFVVVISYFKFAVYLTLVQSYVFVKSID